jgi:hypothetical protein
MVFESLINPIKAEKKPWEMFFIGIVYSSVAVILSTPIHKTCFFFKVISNSVHSFPNSLKVAIL